MVRSWTHSWGADCGQLDGGGDISPPAPLVRSNVPNKKEVGVRNELEVDANANWPPVDGSRRVAV